MRQFPSNTVSIQFFQSLRCQTADGPSEEDIRKTLRLCMHKVGENDYSYENNSDSEQNDDETATRISDNPSYSNDQSHSEKFNPHSNLNGNLYNGNYNNYNNWNASNNLGGMGTQRDYSTQFRNQYPGYTNSFESSNRTKGNKNQTEQDRACLVHCFFHELKMVIIAST